MREHKHAYFDKCHNLNFLEKKIEKEIYPKRKIDQSFTNYHMTPGPTKACHVPILKTHFFLSLSLSFWFPILSETLISLKAILSFLLSFFSLLIFTNSATAYMPYWKASLICTNVFPFFVMAEPFSSQLSLLNFHWFGHCTHSGHCLSNNSDIFF